MEKLFGVSYPTIKNRLNRIAGELPLVEVDERPPADDPLRQLEVGEISVEEAVERLRARRGHRTGAIQP